MEHQWNTSLEDMDETDYQVLLLNRAERRIQVEWLNSIETLPVLCLEMMVALVETAVLGIAFVEVD